MSAPSVERVLVYDRIAANRRNTLLLLAVFAVLVLPLLAYGAGYLFFWLLLLAFGLAGWLRDDWSTAAVMGALVAGAIVCLAAFLQSRYASGVVLRLARAQRLTPLQEPDLEQTVENLCIGAGLPEPELYVVESASPNAFSTGWDPEHGCLAVTRGLLRLLDRRELEAVVAHELSHIGNHDTRLSTVAAIGVAILRLPLVVVVGVLRFLFRLHWIVGAAVVFYFALPLLLSFAMIPAELTSDSPILPWPWLLLMMLFPIYVFFGAPLLGQFIRMATLRQRDFLADADAFLLTRNPEALALALAKMSAAQGPPARAGAATAHLYTVDPLAEDGAWWDGVFRTHPPIEERIAALASMGDGIAPSALEAAREAGTQARPTGPQVSATEGGQFHGALPEEAGPSQGSPQTPLAFRLAGQATILYAEPDLAARQLAQLPPGALVTVQKSEGNFLFVLTGDDSFGYILRSQPMTEVSVDSQEQQMPANSEP